MLLVQAQTLESSVEIKSNTPSNNSRQDISRSLYSSFSEKMHNDIYWFIGVSYIGL